MIYNALVYSTRASNTLKMIWGSTNSVPTFVISPTPCTHTFMAIFQLQTSETSCFFEQTSLRTSTVLLHYTSTASQVVTGQSSAFPDRPTPDPNFCNRRGVRNQYPMSGSLLPAAHATRHPVFMIQNPTQTKHIHPCHKHPLTRSSNQNSTARPFPAFQLVFQPVPKLILELRLTAGGCSVVWSKRGLACYSAI